MRALSLVALAFALGGCVFFDEPDLHEDDDRDGTYDEEDAREPVDCFADLPDEASDELLPGACTKRIDVYAGGVTHSVWVYEYDSDERLIAARNEASATRYGYDAAGRLESTEVDYGLDGLVDVTERRTYDCFGDDPPVPLPGPCSITARYTGAAPIAQIFDYEDGVLASLRIEIDGRVFSVATYVYDDEGLLAETRTDNGDDGSIESVTRFSYDPEGHLLFARVDDMDDGSFDRSTEYTLDDQGRRRFVDEFIRERFTSRIQYEYDDAGHVFRETKSFANDPRRYVTERRYDPAGNLLAEAEHDQRSSEYDQCRRYEYECF